MFSWSSSALSLASSSSAKSHLKLWPGSQESSHSFSGNNSLGSISLSLSSFVASKKMNLCQQPQFSRTLQRFSLHCIATLCDWLKKLTTLFHPIIQPEPRTMVTLSRTISRIFRRLQILISSFDWFIRLSASFVIGLTDYFGFDFSQWEREVNAPNKRQARENKLDQMQVTIGFGFPSVWLGKWRSFFWIKTIHRLFKYIRFTVEMKRKKKKKRQQQHQTGLKMLFWLTP